MTDLLTRNHADLQNINTASYTHLTATNHTDLTDAGDSTLHYHSADRLSIDTINVGETFTIPAGHQLVIADQLTNSGTLVNNGKVYLI